MRFGVVGWGLRASIAKIAHQPERGLELVALAEPNVEGQVAFREFAGEGARVFSDAIDLVEEKLDAVFVLSPDYLHEEHACLFLNRGIPVFLEKPMAIAIESCDRILVAADRTGTKLYVGHNMRHFDMVRKMKEWIGQGLIGEPKTAWCRHFISYGGEAYFRDWHADRRLSNGLLLQKGSHDIDILHLLCNGFSTRVSAMGRLAVYGQVQDRQGEGERHAIKFEGTWPPMSLKNAFPVIDVEDVSLMQMELDNGVLASYQQCHFAPDAWRNYTVIGTEGRIENFGDQPGNCTIKLWDHGRYRYEVKGDLEYRVAERKGTHGGSDESMFEEFLGFLQEGLETSNSPIAARMAVAAGAAGTESIRSGGAVVRVLPLPKLTRQL